MVGSMSPATDFGTAAVLTLVTVLTMLGGFMARESAVPVSGAVGSAGERGGGGVGAAQAASGTAPALRRVAPPRTRHCADLPQTPRHNPCRHTPTQHTRSPGTFRTKAFLRPLMRVNLMHYLWGGLTINQFEGKG